MIKELCKDVKVVKVVYLVFDLDCEGEVIVWYVVNFLKMDLIEKNWVIFYEIIKDVVKEVFKEFCMINMDLVDV